MSRIFFLSSLLILCVSLLLFRLQSLQQPASTAGKIILKGSDTEVQMAAQMAAAFSAHAPETVIAVTGGGSGVGIAALISGEIDIANSSRPMSPAELELASEQGQDVHAFITSRDMLAVIVHPDNPVTELSLDDIGQLFRGEASDWSDVGGANQPVSLYGRQSSSGTFVFFRDAAVKGEYAAQMRSMEGNQAIYDAVAQDTAGIGYVGVGYLRKAKEGSGAVRPLNLRTGDKTYSPLSEEDRPVYPLSRPLYQYLRAVPKPAAPLTAFLKFELSEEGQTVVEESGYFPPSPDDLRVNTELFEKIERKQ